MRNHPSLAWNALLTAETSDESDHLRSELPAGLEIYARTPDFTHLTIPAELTADHALAEGVWGVLRVLEGAVTYIAATRFWPASVGAGTMVVVEPQLAHRLQLCGPTRFFIEFHISADSIRANMPSGSC